jgi:RNA polymerase sigma-70 factor (ECF subfamily)
MSAPPDDPALLLQRWRSGDETAGEELIKLLFPVISRIVRVHLPRRDDESDLVQEILMKTFSRLHQYQATAPLTHWVSRIALTTCLDRLRAQKVRPEVRWSDLTPAESEVFDTTWLEGRAPGPDKAIAARDLVEKLLAVLPPADRSLILMVDLEGRSLEEISQLTGWGLSKVKMRLFRIRGHLRKLMQNWGERG